MFRSGDVVFSSTRLIEAMNQDPALDLERMSLLCRRHGITRQLIERVCLGFSQQRVLIVGDTLLDEYVMCDAVDLASEAPMMSLKELERRLYIGGAGVLARHALNLGAEVYLLSAGTRDNSEQTVINELDTTRLHTHFEPSRPALPCKTRFLVETSKVMRLERGDCCPLDSVAESHACEWVETIADNIDAVIFCDYGYGMLTGGLIERLLDRLRPSVRIMTANSSGPRGRLLEFKGCDLLCPTERMLRSALHDFDSGLSSAAWDALQQTQARQLMVSLGKKGMVAFERPSQDETSAEWRGRLRSEHLPALSEHPLDSLGMDGASQVVASLALASGASLMQAGYLAGAASAVASSQLGNDPITSEQLRRWLGMRMELTHSSRRPPQEPCRFAHERGPETPGRFDQPVRQNPINLPADQTS
jgi:bifunctional ADP-heptose synthase (sugar kinase/adenylyltransferase)